MFRGGEQHAVKSHKGVALPLFHVLIERRLFRLFYVMMVGMITSTENNPAGLNRREPGNTIALSSVEREA